MFCNGIFINSLREGIKKIVDRSVNSGGWGVWATLSPTTRTGIFFYLQKSFFALRWGGGQRILWTPQVICFFLWTPSLKVWIVNAIWEIFGNIYSTFCIGIYYLQKVFVIYIVAVFSSGILHVKNLKTLNYKPGIPNA